MKRHGRYRKVEVSTYSDEKFLQLTPVKPSGQSLWFYLLTGKHTTAIPGLSGLGLLTLAEQLRWPLPMLKKHWLEIERLGMGKADWDAPCIWLPKAHLYNEPESPNVVRAWMKALKEIPACRLRDEAVSALKAYTEGRGEAFAEAFEEPFPQPSRETFPQAFAQSGTGTGAGTRTGRTTPPNPPLPRGAVRGRPFPAEAVRALEGTPPDDRADWFWQQWRNAGQTRSGMSLPLAPSRKDLRKTFEALDLMKNLSDERIACAVSRFMALDAAEASAMNVKAKTLGYFLMALPCLLERTLMVGTSSRTAGNAEAIRTVIASARQEVVNG
jgi:hypothetical protein